MILEAIFNDRKMKNNVLHLANFLSFIIIIILQIQLSTVYLKINK